MEFMEKKHGAQGPPLWVLEPPGDFCGIGFCSSNVWFLQNAVGLVTQRGGPSENGLKALVLYSRPKFLDLSHLFFFGGGDHLSGK